MEKTTFGKRLETLLAEKGVERKALANDAGISVQAIGNYIKGVRKPDYEVTARIAKALGVSADYLLDLTEDPSPDPSIQGAILATGLSGDAVKRLKSATDTDAYKIITRLLESDLFYDAIGEIQKAIECQQSGLVKLSAQLTADILNMFGISSLAQEAEISNHNAHPDKFFDEAISMLAQMAPNITVLSRADTTKFHITEAQNHFRSAVETII